MPYITTPSPTQPTELFYEEVGQGRPVVFIHGWPLSSAMWEYQMGAVAEAGFRAIAYDRRGFGRSDHPSAGYDYDTFADDLNSVLEELNLRNVTLVGFSMGGGEVSRFMSRHGADRIASVVFASAVTPYLLKGGTNPDGVDGGVFKEMKDKLRDDRPAFLDAFGKQFFGQGMLSHPVSKATLDASLIVAMQASKKGTLDCVDAFSKTDFRQDITSIRVPTLIIHGDSDKVVPVESSGRRLANEIPGAVYNEYDGAPHALVITHKEDFNRDLIAFLRGDVHPPV
ncbi:alpha/beta hydrolase [Luteibacter aegosomaticola]|uniref:alpha/beta fold hydrolase n=1 Tax=Luteibacter aegosomaticola TaxID=2911538 RepID=UPI001FF78684|nr:alpha/beta hydrolase [Luteibacter aegosomaticola]UPG88275.1 alpha/beta hydrolase [Luteibacter aegosomaticola]